MRHSTFQTYTAKQVVNRLVFLMVLLPSVHVFAATPATAAGEKMQANPVNGQTASQQVTKTYKVVKNGTPVYRKAINSRPQSSSKVTMDDYERIQHTVSQPKSTTTVWLGNKNRSSTRAKPKTTWLGKKNRSD